MFDISDRSSWFWQLKNKNEWNRNSHFLRSTWSTRRHWWRDTGRYLPRTVCTPRCVASILTENLIPTTTAIYYYYICYFFGWRDYYCVCVCIGCTYYYATGTQRRRRPRQYVRVYVEIAIRINYVARVDCRFLQGVVAQKVGSICTT